MTATTRSSYVGFDPALIESKRDWFNEIIFVSHIFLKEGTDEEELDEGCQMIEYIDALNCTLSINEKCALCEIIRLIKKSAEPELPVSWMCNYASLCHKANCVPMCALSTAILGIEFVHLAVIYGNIEIRSPFISRAISPADVQKHFFVNRCFAPFLSAEKKIIMTHYCNLVMTCMKCIFVSNVSDQSKSNAIYNWKDVARDVLCSTKNCTAASTCQNAKTAVSWKENLSSDYISQYAGFIKALKYLMGDCITDPTRQEELNNLKKGTRFNNMHPKFKPLVKRCKIHFSMGPVALGMFKHGDVKNNTRADCILCNAMLIPHYWVALELMKKDVESYCDRNLSLYDCLEIVKDEWRETRKMTQLLRGTTDLVFEELLILPSTVFYKHFFCDPVCVLNSTRIKPEVLFKQFDEEQVIEAELYKAKIAVSEQYANSACEGLWAIAFAYKYFQKCRCPPKALSLFIKDANKLFKSHGVLLVSLDHTLDNYV